MTSAVNAPKAIDAVVIGSNKVLVLMDNAASGNANILTDTAGWASAGVAITLSSQTTRACVYVSGTDVAVSDGAAVGNTYIFDMVSCSGTSPVLTSSKTLSSAAPFQPLGASNATLNRSADVVFGAAFAQYATSVITTTALASALRVQGGMATVKYAPPLHGGTRYRGKSDSERWLCDGASVITKIECVA